MKSEFRCRMGRAGLSVWIAGLALGMALASPAAAAVWYVKADAAGTNSGASWGDAFTDLQAALAAAGAGDEIWVAAGMYKPTNDYDESKSFVLVRGAGVYGGFSGTETFRDQRDWQTNATILNGDLGFYQVMRTQANSTHVVEGADDAILDGFTITSGYAHGGPPGGGGMLNDSVSPTIRNCRFTHNGANLSTGGGLENINCAPTFFNCEFASNGSSSGTGAGMTNVNSSPTLINCIFFDNSCVDGGGIYSISGALTLIGCVFDRNMATAFQTSRGGGVDARFTSVSMTNCIFAGNFSSIGGGVSCEDSSLILSNCMFIGNSGSEASALFTSGTASIVNTIIWGVDPQSGSELVRSGGNATFTTCAIQGSGGSGAEWDASLGTDGGGNLDADPLFVDAGNPAGADGVWGTADDGLALAAGSPCIDAGTAEGAPELDLLGHGRVGLPDLGAYEFPTVRTKAAAAGWVLYE